MQGTTEVHPHLVAERMIGAKDLPIPRATEPLCAEHPAQGAGDLSLDAVILNHVLHVLELNRGNKLRAARQLGIGRSTLYRILGDHAGKTGH